MMSELFTIPWECIKNIMTKRKSVQIRGNGKTLLEAVGFETGGFVGGLTTPLIRSLYLFSYYNIEKFKRPNHPPLPSPQWETFIWNNWGNDAVG
jgi:hypothetical protein